MKLFQQKLSRKEVVILAILGFAILASIGYMTYVVVANGSSTNVTKESKSSSDSGITSASSSVLDSWKTYQNEEYNFSFKFPDFYNHFKTEGESDKAYAETYPDIYVAVKELDGYRFTEPNDVPITYNHSLDEWRQGFSSEDYGQREKINLETVPVRSGVAYKFTRNVIAGKTDEYAIPVPSRDAMIEISFIYNTDTGGPSYPSDYTHTSNDINQKSIISSLNIPESREVFDQSESVESWRSYQNVSHWFSFAYPEKWALSTRESEESDVVVARVVNPKFSGRADTDIPTEQFLVREMSYGACESGEESSLADRDTLDTGWITDEFTGLPLRDICFKSDDIPLKITLSARDDSSKNTLNRMLNSFDFTALPDTPLTLEDIESQYTDELLQSAAFVDEVDGNQAVVSRVPIRFSAWDQIGTEDEPLMVINLLYTESAEMPNGYEIILFDTDSSYNISNPIRIDEGSTAGSYSEVATDYEITPHDTPGHFAVNLEIHIPEISNDSDEKRYIEKEFARTDGEVDIISDNQDTEEFFLSGIKAQYTDELLSDPAFITEGNMVKGGREFAVTDHTPKASVFWDHDNDGEESLAVLNNASNVFELILFDIDENNQISNPQRIDNGGTATYVWNSADLQLISTDDGEEFLRSSIRLGQSAPQTNDYTYVQLFDATGQFVKIDDGEVQ